MGNCNYGYTVKPYHAVHLNQAVRTGHPFSSYHGKVHMN